MSPLLELVAVHKAFSPNEPAILRGIDLSLAPGESLALVGESGCGKTTLGKLITDLHQPTAGKVLYKGQDLRTMTKKEYQAYRLKVANDSARFLCGTQPLQNDFPFTASSDAKAWIR